MIRIKNQIGQLFLVAVTTANAATISYTVSGTGPSPTICDGGVCDTVTILSRSGVVVAPSNSQPSGLVPLFDVTFSAPVSTFPAGLFGTNIFTGVTLFDPALRAGASGSLGLTFLDITRPQIPNVHSFSVLPASLTTSLGPEGIFVLTEPFSLSVPTGGTQTATVFATFTLVPEPNMTPAILGALVAIAFAARRTTLKRKIASSYPESAITQ